MAGFKGWLAGVFDRAAPTYDRVGSSYHGHFGRRLVEVAGVGPGTRVLDVACGAGAVSVPAAERVGPTGRVIGVDLSTAMIHQAHEASVPAGLLVMDAEHLGLRGDVFDTVLAAFVVFFLPDPERAAAGWLRVLAPGGSVGVSTWADDDPRWAWEDELWGGVQVAQRAIKRSFEDPDDVARLLVGAGFTDVRIHLEHHDVHFTTEDDWWAWKWSYSIRGVLEQMDDAAQAALRDAAFERLQYLRDAEGFPLRLTAAFALGRRPG